MVVLPGRCCVHGLLWEGLALLAWPGCWCLQIAALVCSPATHEDAPKLVKHPAGTTRKVLAKPMGRAHSLSQPSGHAPMLRGIEPLQMFLRPTNHAERGRVVRDRLG